MLHPGRSQVVQEMNTDAETGDPASRPVRIAVKRSPTATSLATCVRSTVLGTRWRRRPTANGLVPIIHSPHLTVPVARTVTRGVVPFVVTRPRPVTLSPARRARREPWRFPPMSDLPLSTRIPMSARQSILASFGWKISSNRGPRSTNLSLRLSPTQKWSTSNTVGSKRPMGTVQLTPSTPALHFGAYTTLLMLSDPKGLASQRPRQPVQKIIQAMPSAFRTSFTRKCTFVHPPTAMAKSCIRLATLLKSCTRPLLSTHLPTMPGPITLLSHDSNPNTFHLSDSSLSFFPELACSREFHISAPFFSARGSLSLIPGLGTTWYPIPIATKVHPRELSGMAHRRYPLNLH